jgi:hypothetical protein
MIKKISQKNDDSADQILEDKCPLCDGEVKKIGENMWKMEYQKMGEDSWKIEYQMKGEHNWKYHIKGENSWLVKKKKRCIMLYVHVYCFLFCFILFFFYYV